jgi:Na+/proline symporter
MAVIFGGLIITFFIIINSFPENVSLFQAVEIASIGDKMKVLDFSFDLENRYTVWSGLIGGTFLALSYFGTDQSQVQRYLSGKSLKEMQLGMIFNGVLKIPMQFFILFLGILVFVFYQFNPSPLNFNPQAKINVVESDKLNEYSQLESSLEEVYQLKKDKTFKYLNKINNNLDAIDEIKALNIKEKNIRERAKEIINEISDVKNIKIESNDTDYIFLNFILNNLPKGLIGLLIAVMLSAAMSSTASELNALATTTTIDIYKRNKKIRLNDIQTVIATKIFTVMWGVFAIVIACIAYLADNLIELVNIIGSIFYGNVLGIFLIAFFIKYVKSNAVFIAALITQAIIIFMWYNDLVPYLWLNFVGAILVITISLIIQFIIKNK